MAERDVDLLVIGGGSAGLRAARLAAELGARVALSDPNPLGGTCVNAGCVPKKLFWYAGHFAAQFADAAGYGWQVRAEPIDWPELRRRKDAAIAGLNGYYERLLRETGVHYLPEVASFVDATTVLIAGRHHRPKRMLIATGARPAPPGFPGWELGITSDDVFHLPVLPERTLIVGGGYIGLEFAGIFHALGCTTTLVHRHGSLLRGFDTETTAFLADQMRTQGLDLRLRTSVLRVERASTGLTVTLSDGTTIETDLVLNAVGRIPNTARLNLAAAGIAVTARGAIETDTDYRTNLPHIYAIGDVTARMQLTPVALAEAAIVARRLYGGGAPDLDYGTVPTAVFSTPNLASVGLTESAARERYGDIDVYTKHFRPLQHMLSDNAERVFMKLLVERDGGRVVGVHMVGPDAAEIVQGLAIALQAGATKQQFDATVGIHPTAAEEFVSMRTRRPH